jgi:hypothetical protein
MFLCCVLKGKKEYVKKKRLCYKPPSLTEENVTSKKIIFGELEERVKVLNLVCGGV